MKPATAMSCPCSCAGLTREGLYKALSINGNPSLATALKVLNALGIRLVPKVA